MIAECVISPPLSMPKIHLTVSPQTALDELRTIPHRNILGAVISGKHWQAQGKEVCWSSACWLFCWAKTGQGSRRAAIQARAVLNRILDKDFAWFDAHVDLEDAREQRYKPCS